MKWDTPGQILLYARGVKGMMEKWKRLVSVSVVALVVCVGADLHAGVTLPYATSFESESLGTFSGDASWTASGVEITAADAVHSNQSCIVTNSLTLNVDSSAEYTNAWIRVYVKPSPVSPLPTPDDQTACAFCVDSLNQLRAYSGDTWEILQTGFPVGQWVGFAVHVDYKMDKWDLYWTTGSGGAGTVYDKANKTTALSFNTAAVNNVTNLTEVTVSSADPTYVDAVLAGRGGFDVDDDSASNLVVQTIGAIQNARMMLGFLGNTYSAGENSLTDLLGDYLQSFLREGDEITIYDTNNVNQIYQFDPDDPDGWVPLFGSDDPSGIYVTSGMGVWLTPTNSDTIYGFGAYNAGAEPPGTVIPGKDAVAKGWRQLAWTRPFDSVANSGANRWGFAGGVAEAGDRLYVSNIVDGTWHVLHWHDPTGTWKEGFWDSIMRMARSQGFWYYKWLHAGSKTWPSHQGL